MFTRSRKRLDQVRTRLEDHESLTGLRSFLSELGEREISIVERAWRSAQQPGLRGTALVVSWLGNGSAYVILGVVFFFTLDHAVWPLLASGVAVLIAHLIYPWTKLACGRERPFEQRGELKPHLASLDKHSFPSGHAMTLTAAFLPMVTAFPVIWPVALFALLLMAWSRVACAHHYPSDVIAGAVLGIVVAAPLTVAFV